MLRPWTIITVLIGILGFLFILGLTWVYGPQTVSAMQSITDDLNYFIVGLTLGTLFLSILLAGANFLHSQDQQMDAITPSIHVKLVFVPGAMQESAPVETNQLWLEVINLHSNVSPMNLKFTTSYRTVDMRGNKLKRAGIPQASNWKPSYQWLEYLRSNEKKRIHVLYNTELEVSLLTPKLINEARNQHYHYYEVLPVPIHLEVRIDCEYDLSMPGTKRQHIKTVRYYCHPSHGPQTRWNIFTDLKARTPVATRSEAV